MEKKTWAFASDKILPKIAEEIEKKAKLFRLQALPTVYEAVCQHADIQMMMIEDRIFFDEEAYHLLGQNQMNHHLIKEMEKLGDKIVLVKGRLGKAYPKSVAFNGKYCEGTFIHHLMYSAPEITDYCLYLNIERIHVQQGYTGCSLFLLPSRHAITSDLGIEKALKAKGYEVLRIEEGHIHLEGLPYGFIGGCMGVLNKLVFVNGNLYTHPNGKQIIDFIDQQGYQIIMDETCQTLNDIGSILFY